MTSDLTRSKRSIGGQGRRWHSPVLYLSYRKLRLLYDKSLRQDAHSREDVICRRRPRSARECAEAHSYIYLGEGIDIPAVEQFLLNF